MKKNFWYWFRWICVLPGSILSAFLMTIPLHMLLYLLFSVSGEVDPGSIKYFLGLLFRNISAHSVEYLLYPSIMAFTYIMVGTKIAPEYKRKTTTILFVVYLLMWISVMSYLIFTGQFVNNTNNFFRPFFAITGAILGFIGARKTERDWGQELADNANLNLKGAKKII